MKCTVLSRDVAKALSYMQMQVPCVIISITDTDSDSVDFAPNSQIRAILHLSFNDVDRGEPNAMTNNDADRIVHFCMQWLPNMDLIVQCEAGISRSAGVCAAVLKWHTGSDTQIFDNPHYRPNMHCYRQVLSAFERVSSDVYKTPN